MIEKKNIQDAYKYYKRLERNPVTLATYRSIVNGFVKFIIRKVFEGYEVRLSSGNSLGSLCIRGKKPKVWIDDEGKVHGLVPDWAATRKLWKEKPELKEEKFVVFHTNDNTGGIRYKFVWLKFDTKLANKTLYSIVPARDNKRELAKIIKQGKEYFVSPEKIM